MSTVIGQLAWFLPWCWFVNMSLTVFGFMIRHMPLLERYDLPVDRQMRLPDGSRIIGDTTTWGGILFTVLLGAAGEALVPGHSFFMLALLVKAGDALGSFIKRRFSFPKGTFLPFIDHGDYVLLTGAVLLLEARLSLAAFLIAYVGTLILTPGITYTAYLLRIRQRPW